MSGSRQNRFLKLVVDEKTAEAKRQTADWFGSEAPDPVPDDCALIAQLDDYPGLLNSRDLRELIENLVSEGRLDKIQIGARQYLTRQSQPVIARDDDRELFRLEIALDLEREKQLLFKLVIVIELIVIALIVRQWALDPGFLLRLIS